MPYPASPTPAAGGRTPRVRRPRNVIRGLTTGGLVAAMIAGGMTAVPLSAAAADSVSLYVSPQGDDGGNGSLNSPFRTLEHARDVVRGLNDSMDSDITVYLRGGTYPVVSTIEFTADDSGSNGHRITYAAYQNEKPVLEAGQAVTGWSRVSDTIWKAPLSRADKLRSLYVDGARMQMASKWVWANECQGQYTVTAGQAPWAWESGQECDGSSYGLDAIPAIPRNQQDVEVMTQTTWQTAITGVREVTTTADGSQRKLLFQQPGAAIAQGAAYAALRATGWQKVSNAYELLDEPGEFFFDREAQTVYLYKDGNTNLATASVMAPRGTETVLSVAGTSTSQRATNLTFSGLTIRHSDWNLAKVDGSSFKQVTQGNLVNTFYGRKNFHEYTYRNVQLEPGAVEVTSAQGVEFLGNHIEHTGADGIQFINDVVDGKIEGNAAVDIGGTAISIGDPQHVYIGDGTPQNGERFAPGVEGAPKNISVRNNYTLDTAVLFWGSPAVAGYFLDTVQIENNRIEKTSWAGVSLGWGWWNFDGSYNSINPGNPTTVARNNSVQRNEFIDVMRFLSDSGPLYSLGDQRGSVISENFTKGIRSGHTYGLHPDEGSANITYNNNVFEAPRDIAYVINSGNWGKQHDLSIRNTYGPINSIFDRPVPASTIDDVIVVPDFVWPAPAYNAAVGSGLQPDYRSLLGQTARTADFAMPASVLVTDSDSAIPTRGVGDRSATLWLAPAGTTTFSAGPTMTSAPGDASSLTVPTARGDYKLYVVKSDGSVASTSSATAVRTAPAPRNQKMTLLDAQKCLDSPGSSTSNGTQVALWNCKGDPNQLFTHTSRGEISVLGKCLTAEGGNRTAGTRVVLQDCAASAPQKWTLAQNGTITGVDSGLCLVTSNGNLNNGAGAVLSPCTGASNQRWDFPVSDYTRAKLAVETSASSRCMAGKAVVTVTVKNTNALPVKASASTPWGTQSSHELGAGKTASFAFTTRAKTIPAGEATSSVSATVDGSDASVSASAPYAARTCN